MVEGADGLTPGAEAAGVTTPTPVEAPPAGVGQTLKGLGEKLQRPREEEKGTLGNEASVKPKEPVVTAEGGVTTSEEETQGSDEFEKIDWKSKLPLVDEKKLTTKLPLPESLRQIEFPPDAVAYFKNLSVGLEKLGVDALEIKNSLDQIGGKEENVKTEPASPTEPTGASEI